MSDEKVAGEAGTGTETAATAGADQVTTGTQNDTVSGGAGTDATVAATGGTDKPVTAPADWPENWRERIAGKDEDALKRLKRFKSVENVFTSYRDLEKRVSSGEYKPDRPFPADGSDEDKAAWRAEKGLPPTPDAYLEKLPDGLVIGERDKPLVETFVKTMHDRNAPPEIVGDALSWYYQTQERMAAEQAERDKAFYKEADEKLYAKWGPEKTANIRHMHSALFDGLMGANGEVILPNAPDGVRELLYGARLPNGRKLGDDPDVLSWLVEVAHTVDPVGRVLPSGNGSSRQGMESEIAAIEAEMRDSHSDYHRNPKKQERLRELYTAQERIGNRGRAA